jgi:hypothetical protein
MGKLKTRNVLGLGRVVEAQWRAGTVQRELVGARRLRSVQRSAGGPWLYVAEVAVVPRSLQARTWGRSAQPKKGDAIA